MNNLSMSMSLILLWSLGGWYVVFNKYLELKAMVKNLQGRLQAQQEEQEEVTMPIAAIDDELEDYANYAGGHIPGMGPPPLTNMPFTVPEEMIKTRRRLVAKAPESHATASTQPTPPTATATVKPASLGTEQKRKICNWACIMHLAGFGFLTGIPFVNILLPGVVWLLKKEQHSYLAKQGREVINFQITYTLIQFICLGAGALFVWLAPVTAAGLFNATKTMRVVFSTSMYLPFNIFTVIPFFWASIVTLRGAVAAYHGVSYKYPLAQPFIYASNPAVASAPQVAPPPTPAAEPAPAYSGPNFGGLGNISFG
jgi:uncharacterized Tic20 family protein